ncbi:MAG: hypothetical protein HZA36_00950 [Parcubacteria group bacterium]|nr:hypothetical protein [Parcubacteria group bacterium]
MLEGIWFSILIVWGYVWWLAMPLILFYVFSDLWMSYVGMKYFKDIEWVTLEVRIPREILKTPKSMEQIFNGMHAIQAYISRYDKIIKGKFQEWISFELAGTGGGVNFYVHTPVQFRNLVESQIYAQYPDAEVVVVDDYTSLIAHSIPNEEYDIWGADYIFVKPNPYPIKTYLLFEDIKDERRVDPLAGVIETMSQLKSNEMMWIQLLIKPAPKSFKEESDELIDKLVGKTPKSKKWSLKIWFDGILEFAWNLAKGLVDYPTWQSQAEAPKDADAAKLTPGKKEVLEAVERKASHLGFETSLRMIYIDRRDSFTRVNVAALSGGFKIFNTSNMNAFKPNMDTLPNSRGWFWLFKKQREYMMKRNIVEAYRLRLFPKGSMVMSSEELATIYHYPNLNVAAPFLRRLETKKGQPPPNLPI